MKKATLLIVLIALVTSFVGAQDWKSKFDEVKHLTKGFKAVKKGEKWGFVDEKGRELCPIQYDEFVKFNNDLAVIKKDNKYGFVNKKAKKFVHLNLT